MAVLIGQIQAPEDAPTPQPAPIPLPLPQTPPQLPAATDAPATDGENGPVAPPAPAPVAPVTPTLPARPSFLQFLWTHIRTDPAARLCMFTVSLHPFLDADYVPCRDFAVPIAHRCVPHRHRAVFATVLHWLALLEHVDDADIPFRAPLTHKRAVGGVPRGYNTRPAIFRML